MVDFKIYNSRKIEQTLKAITTIKEISHFAGLIYPFLFSFVFEYFKTNIRQHILSWSPPGGNSI